MRLAPTLVALFAVTVVSGAGGCVAIDTSEASGGRVQLVSELANRLDKAGALTYTAVYRLPQGDSATISQAQSPFRASYTYPGGKLILGPQGTTDCRTQDAVPPARSPPPRPPAPIRVPHCSAGSRYAAWSRRPW